MTKTSAAETLLATFAAQRQQTHRDSWSEYHNMLKALHNGEAVAPDEAREIITAVGKSETDLAKDIATYGQRVQWSQTIAAHTKVEAELKKLEKEIERDQKVIADLKSKLEPKLRNYELAFADFMGKNYLVLTAREQLMETSFDVPLNEDIARLEDEVQPLRDRCAWLQRVQEKAGDASNEPERRELLKAIAKLEAQIEKLREQKLEP